MASHELSRSSIISTGIPRALSTRAANALASSDISLGVPSRCKGNPTTMRRTACSPYQLAQTGEIAPAIDPRPGRKRTRRHAALVRERQAQPLQSVVDRKHHACGSGRWMGPRGAKGNGHADIITWKKELPWTRGGPCHLQGKRPRWPDSQRGQRPAVFICSSSPVVFIRDSISARDCRCPSGSASSAMPK